MLRDITIGQYYQADSPLHRLDPRMKIVASLCYMVSLFLIQSYWGYVVTIGALGLVIVLSKVPMKFMLKGLKPILFLIIFAFLLNALMTPGAGEPLVKFGFITMYKEGLIRAVLMALRLVLLIVGTSLLTLTTSPIDLTDGVEYLLSPLKVIRVPAHEIAMMMTIALRYIPILLEETDKIMKAQMARGADFESGNIVKRAKALIPLLVPLFISAFKRADELAMAMEARCYRGGEGRTRLKVLHFRWADMGAFVIVGGFMASCIVL